MLLKLIKKHMFGIDPQRDDKEAADASYLRAAFGQSAEMHAKNLETSKELLSAADFAIVSVSDSWYFCGHGCVTTCLNNGVRAYLKCHSCERIKQKRWRKIMREKTMIRKGRTLKRTMLKVYY